MKMIKRHFKGILVFLIIITGAAVGLTFFFKNKTVDTEAKVIKQNAVPLTKQTLTKSISATGTIESSKTKSVSANVNNMTVKKVKVQVGDTVKKGQALVTFDKTDLKEALKEAKENLAEAESEAGDNISDAKEQLSEAKEAYSNAKTQAAKAEAEEKKQKAAQEKAEKEAKAAQEKAQKQAKEAKAKAKKALKAAKKKVSSLEKKLAKTKTEQQKMQLEQELSKAKQDLEIAQKAYETAGDTSSAYAGNGTGSTNTSYTSYTGSSTGNGSGSSVSQAKSGISTAEKNLKNTKKSAEKSIKEAKKQVEQAKENLEKCAVVSPITGIVTAVNVEDGEAYTGGTMFQIEDISSFKVTTSVDEYNISDVSVGQKVVILTEATGDEEINGKIIFVAPSTSATYSVSGNSGNSAGASTGMGSSSSSDGYEVVIEITDKNDKLKMGMTAKCSMIFLADAGHANVWTVTWERRQNVQVTGGMVMNIKGKKKRDDKKKGRIESGMEQKKTEHTGKKEDSRKNGSSVIELKGIVKRFFIGQPNELEILHGIDLEVKKGEFLSIVGESGSGKSTLMNIIGALDRPTEGTYLLDDTDICKAKDKKLSEIRNQKIGFVFQTYNLLARQTALDNVELPMLYAGMRKAERIVTISDGMIIGSERGMERRGELVC